LLIGDLQIPITRPKSPLLGQQSKFISNGESSNLENKEHKASNFKDDKYPCKGDHKQNTRKFSEGCESPKAEDERCSLECMMIIYTVYGHQSSLSISTCKFVLKS